MPGNPLVRFDEGRVGRTRKVSSSLLLYSIANGHPNRILVHFETGYVLGEMEQPLPAVSEAVRPLSRNAVRLVPDVLLDPGPTLPLKRKD